MAKMIFVCARGVLVVTDSDGSYTVPATSGSGECLNNSSASCRRRKNVGPIPAGLYYIFRSQLNDPIAVRDYIRNKWFGDWGDWRIPLRNAAGSAPLGREGFFLLVAAVQVRLDVSISADSGMELLIQIEFSNR